MEMEKINENTIRVVLDDEDLTARGIKFLDLLGNQKEIESFFYEILDEVDVEHEFRENDAVTFQLVPNKESGLEIFITKVNPDDITDQGGEKETENENETVEDTEDVKKDIDSSSDELLNLIKNSIENSRNITENRDYSRRSKIDDDEVIQYLNDDTKKKYVFVVEFSTFEDFVQLAHVLRIEGGVSNLYSYQEKYYLELVLFDDNYSEESAKDLISLSFEYGKNSKISPVLLKERGKLVMGQTALELARYYFK